MKVFILPIFPTSPAEYTMILILSPSPEHRGVVYCDNYNCAPTRGFNNFSPFDIRRLSRCISHVGFQYTLPKPNFVHIFRRQFSIEQSKCWKIDEKQMCDFIKSDLFSTFVML